MPLKRRATAPAKPSVPTKRPSKLAKENNLTADQEAEIREAFSLFAINHPEHDEKEGVMRTEDVRRCLISLNLGPSQSDLPTIYETVDPTKSGFVSFVTFLEYAAIAIHSKTSGSDESEGDDYEDEVSDAAEVRSAFSLFTHGGSGPITLAHLRRIAKELREEVPDEVLKDMIREANSSVKGKGREKDVGTVSLEDFESVMKRAGVSFG